MSRDVKNAVNLFFESPEVSDHISDWSPIPQGIKLPPNVYVSNSIKSVSPKNMGLYYDDQGKIRCSGYVGVGWLKDQNGRTVIDSDGKECAIMIRPRFKSMDPWRMLIKVMSDDEYDNYIKEKGSFYSFETSQKLIPVPKAEKRDEDDAGGAFLAALSFLKSCERICRRNLNKKMSFEEQNFNGRVVGNIQVSKQIKHNVINGREDRIYCRYPVFTIDTLENRILKAALHKAHQILAFNRNRCVDIKRIYSYCVNALKAVTLIQISKSDIKNADVTGCNAHYKNAIQLAKVLFFNEGICDLINKTDNGTHMVIPYAINMEQLFEFYVRSVIKDSFSTNNTEYKLDEYRNKKDNPLHVLKDTNTANNLYIMKNYIPDIAIYTQLNATDEKNYVAVFDVKYQHGKKTRTDDTVRENSHQLLFYMLLLNVNTCGFIFPKESNVLECTNGVPLQIQRGNRIPKENNLNDEGFYTQWLIDIADESCGNSFSSRVVSYLDKLKKERIKQSGE